MLNLVLSNGSENMRNMIQRHKNSFFSKTYKKLSLPPAAGGGTSDPPQ